jgi:Spy/CpxP family protein refolding chaperone
MKTIKILILTISLAMITMPALAQRQPQGPPPDERESEFAPDPGPGNPPTEERREEIRKKIEAIRIWRLTEALKLDADTSVRLSSILSSLDLKRREIQREQMEAMRALRQTLRSPKPDEAKLKSLLDRLESNHRSMQELREREIKNLKEILSPEQQARFLIFQQEFQREMRGIIEGARGGGQGQGMRGTGQGRGM